MPALVDLPASKRRAITAALLVGTFLASLEVMVVSPAMPVVVAEFGQAGLYPWVFTAYMATQTLTIPFYGYMADRHGRRNAYVLGVSLFLLGSVGCALAWSMAAVVGFRTVQGLGAGALITLTMTIFGDLYHVDARTRMQGAFSVIWGLSSLLGPLVGGYLTEMWSWRSIFWINIIPGAIAAALIVLLVPGEVGINPATRPLRDIGVILKDATQQAVALSGLVIGAALFGVVAYLPVQVQAVQGGGAIDAGLALIPLSVLWTIATFVAGRLVPRTGFRFLVRLGTLTTAVGALVSALWTANAVGLMIFGTGMGFTISSFTVSCQEAAPLHLRGTATSLSFLARSLGSALSVPVFGLVAGMRPGATSFAAIDGLALGVQQVFFWVAGCALVGALIVVLRFPSQSAGAPASPRHSLSSQ